MRIMMSRRRFVGSASAATATSLLGIAPALGDDAYIADRFRTIDNWCTNNSYPGGWPSFNQATYPNPTRTVYEHFIFKPNVFDWRSVPATEYAATDIRSRFTGAHDYALREGYQQGFPNFQEADAGHGVEYGTYLVPPNTAYWLDVAVQELGMGTGEPTSHPMDDWFKGAADYAARNGYVAGMPNGHYANYGQGWVCGVFLFSASSVDRMDIRGQELGLWEQPTQGMLPVTFRRHDPSTFTYTTMTTLPVGLAPTFAVIDRIRNMAEDNQGNTAIPLDLSFKDVNQRPAGPMHIEPTHTVTGDFVGLSLAGQWKAEVTSGSNVFLRDHFDLEVYWTA